MTGFQVGDWVCLGHNTKSTICANPSCAYHNFARNTWCRKCNTRKTQLSPDSSATTSNSAIPSQSNSLNSSLASSTNNWVPAREPIVGSIAKVSADTLTLVQQDEQGEWQNWDYKPDSARDKNQGTVWKVERGQISEPVVQHLHLRQENSRRALFGRMVKVPRLREALGKGADDAFPSANGDVRADFALCEAWFQQGCWTLLAPCVGIYGITDLRMGRGSDEHLRSPSAPEKGEMTPERWIAACDSANVDQDENMLAILNARGTVVMNAYFHGTPEQTMIVKLADTAIHLYDEWLATVYDHKLCDFKDRFDTRAVRTRTSEPYNKLVIPQYHRYKLMVLAIRDDIQTHMMRRLERLPKAPWNAQIRAYEILQERIDTWRWYAARTATDYYERECSYAEIDKSGITRRRTWLEPQQRSWTERLRNYVQHTDAYLARLPNLDFAGPEELPRVAEDEVVEPGRGALYYMGGVLYAVGKAQNDKNFYHGAKIRFEGWEQGPSGLWFPFLQSFGTKA